MLALLSIGGNAQITSVSDGPWLSFATWQAIPPSLTDCVIINNNVTLSLDWGLNPGGSITVNAGASLSENLPGRAFVQQGGTIINNGTIDFSTFVITTGILVNNDFMRVDQNFYSAGIITNNGLIDEIDSLWNDGIFSNNGPGGEIIVDLFFNTDSINNGGVIGFLEGVNAGILTNGGVVASVLFLNDGEFENISPSSLNAVDFWNNASMINNIGSSVNVSRDFFNGDSLLPISGPLLFNDGFFGVGRDWYNADSIIGVTGRFCIGQGSFNWGYIGGTVDICDNTGGAIDLSIGPNASIESTVTTCMGGLCAMVVAVEEKGPRCNGGSDGSIVLNVYGGTGPYNYSWSNSATGDSVGGLTEDVYVIIVKDATDSIIVVVDLNTPPIVATLVTTESICGMPNGSASVSASQGIPPYSYLWDDPSGQTTALATGLGAGTYNITITDIDSCSITDTLLVSAKSVMAVSSNITPVTCLLDANGGIDVAVTGGTPPYDYLWSPDIGTGPQAAELKSGDYTIIITDADTCQVPLNATIPVEGGIECVDWKIFSGLTPNGDGVDDYWEIRGLEQFQPVSVQIFTNRGVVVWSSDNYKNEWQGTDQDGEPLVEGVYYYLVIRPEKEERGWVHIVR